jgi:predicted transcriptional regulator
LTLRGIAETLKQILETTMQGASKPKIAQHLQLTYTCTTRCITFLENRAMLFRVEGKPETYRTTEKGKKYIKEYNQLFEN